VPRTSCRLLIGARTIGLLLPASYLAGAIFARVGRHDRPRTVLGVTEIPSASWTAICGAPVFAYLLPSARRDCGDL
jgi:ABC-type Fe3+-siderophore transport system permease subunit